MSSAEQTNDIIKIASPRGLLRLRPEQEAGATGRPVRLTVAATNEAAMRLYLRLGFARTASELSHIEMEWRVTPAKNTRA